MVLLHSFFHTRDASEIFQYSSFSVFLCEYSLELLETFKCIQYLIRENSLDGSNNAMEKPKAFFIHQRRVFSERVS